MSGQLQELIDDLAQELERPIEIEDRRWRLIAFSIQYGEIDRVRRDSILGRRAPSEVVDFLAAQDLGRTDAPTRVAAGALGMEPRTCLALRAHDVLLGFLWVIDGAAALDEAETARLISAGDAVTAALWEERVRSDERRRRRAEIVEQLLDDQDHEGARRSLAADLGWPADGPYAVAIGTGPEIEAGDHARRRWRHGELLAGQWEGHPLVIARLEGGASTAELASVLAASGAELAGAGGVVESLAEVGTSVSQAMLAVRVARATGHEASTVCFEDLDGGWRLVAELWHGAGEPSPPAAIRALESHPQAADLLRTLEATLESDGDVSAAAAELHMHRATLYRRIERIEEITGLNLSAGDDRLLAQLGLRLRRLARTADAFGDPGRG